MQKIIGLIVAGIILIGGAYFIFDGIKDVKTAPVVLESTVTDVMNKVEDAAMMKKEAEGVMEKVDDAMEKVEDVMEKTEESVEDVMEKTEDAMEKHDDEVMMKKEDGDVMVKNVSEEISLASVDPRGGDAQAARIYKDGVFTHYVTVNNIDPAEGKFFEGWITTNSAFISTGKMEKDDAGMWRLTYTSNDDKLMYNRVVITEETSADGLDNKPETHIFEGEF